MSTMMGLQPAGERCKLVCLETAARSHDIAAISLNTFTFCFFWPFSVLCLGTLSPIIIKRLSNSQFHLRAAFYELLANG